MLYHAGLEPTTPVSRSQLISLFATPVFYSVGYPDIIPSRT